MDSLSKQRCFHKVNNMVIDSTPIVRKLFQARWKKETGTVWEHSERQGKAFIEGLGQTVYNKDQKDVIAKGYLGDWDLPTFSVVLQNFGDPSRYEVENGFVRQLATLMNDMTNHPTKKLSLQEYNEKVEVFRASLKGLGVMNEEIDTCVTKAGTTSSDAALQSAEKLFEEAKTLMNRNEFDRAILCYSKAMQIPSLLAVHQAAAYEKRGECYMKLFYYKKQKRWHKTDNHYMEQYNYGSCHKAIEDGIQALKLNDCSRNADYIMAQGYMYISHREASLQHYTQALVLSPDRMDIKIDFETLLVMRMIMSDNGYLLFDSMPEAFSEKLEYFQRATARKITKEEYVSGLKHAHGQPIPGQDNVSRGHQQLYGWTTTADNREAALHYKKAAEVGNPEGLTYLGICYFLGVGGVAQDFPAARKLFIQAAEMSPDEIGRFNTVSKNVGVTTAQYCLGLMFWLGISVKQDNYKACAWLTKAAENGSGPSATKLASLYFTGVGVPKKSEKKGEMYLNQAIALKDANAAILLMSYYGHHLEPENMMVASHTGVVLGHPFFDRISDSDFSMDFMFMTREILDKEKVRLCEFEKQFNLESKGYTHFQRMERMKAGAGMKYEQYPAADNTQVPTYTSDDIAFYKRKADAGSSTAAAVMHFITTNAALVELMTKKKTFNDSEAREILDLVYNCFTNSTEIANFSLLIYNDLISLMERLLHKYCGPIGEEDMKIRICYVRLNFVSQARITNNKKAELLREGVRRYPDNVQFCDLLSRIHHSEKTHLGFVISEEGLKKFPNNVELLFGRAAQLWLLAFESRREQDKEMAIAAFQHFLRATPADHYRVPAAYYHQGLLFQAVAGETNSELVQKARTLMEQYYNLGISAEKFMLPRYLPYVCPMKFTLEGILYKPDSAFNEKPPGEPLPFAVGILQRKPYLNSPVRKEMITSHRQRMKEFSNSDDATTIALGMENMRMCAPVLKQSATPQRQASAKGITLKEMHPTTDYVFNGRRIELVIIDDLNLDLEWIELIAEDENFEVIPLFIFNMEKSKESLEKLEIGSRVVVFNPYFQVGDEDNGKMTGIRIDDPECFKYVGKMDKICRFCKEENAVLRCSKCKKAGYCSKECQKYDWKELKHKLICFVN